MAATTGRWAALAILFAATALAADWLRFRGPAGSGVSDERGLPVKWGPKDNIAWKIELPGPGGSSPIIHGDRIFLTSYTGYGLTKKDKGDVKDLRRLVLGLDRKTGKTLWQREVETKLPENDYSGFVTEHGYASSTPATDGERLYVFFGRTGVLAYDLDGNPLWHVEVGKGLNSWGSAASPVVHKGLVYINASVESGSLLALDAKTGKEVWKVKGVRDNWSTPALVELPGGKTELVLNQGNLVGYDAATGKELWSCDLVETPSATTTPVVRDGRVYAMAAGFTGRGIVAVKAGGRGDVTKTHVIWKQNLGSNVTSPLLYGDYLYYGGGRAGCIEAATGKPMYEERLYEGRREYVSPVAGDGKVYFFTRQNGCYVLAAGPKFEQLAHNELGDRAVFNSSPAISNGQILWRSDRYLYCIGAK